MTFDIAVAFCNWYTAWLIFKHRCKNKTVQFFSLYYSPLELESRISCVLCFYLVSIFWRSTISHGLPFCNSKKYGYIIIFVSYDGRPCRPLTYVNFWRCYAGKLLFLGTVTSFLQRHKFRFQVQNTKPRYMRALVTMLLKYAREFSRYLMTSHTRASKSKQSWKTNKN